VIRITRDLAGRLTRAIQAAQQAGELPDFEIPQIKITSAAKPEYGDYSSNTPLQIQGLAGMPGKGRQIAEVLVMRWRDYSKQSAMKLRWSITSIMPVVRCRG
jgi:arginyl-tRNA synthetase